MSRSLDIGDYPEQYLAAAERFEAGQPVSIEYPSQRDMKAGQLDLYGFRRALLKDGGDVTYARFVRTRFQGTQVAPWIVRFVHVDDSFVGKFVELPPAK